MADDDYDLLPHRQLNELKRQMQELKSRADRASPKELIDAMDALARSIESLMNLFHQAADEMKYEDKEQVLSGGSEHKAMNERLDKIMEQNKVIADGMVAVSDMVKDFVGKGKKQQTPKPRPRFQPSMRAPTYSQNFQPQFNAPSVPPRPQMPSPGLMEEPPLPDFEEEPKKKGLFGMFKK